MWVGAVVISDKYRVARFRGVIDQTDAIRRPSNLGGLFIHKIVWRSADERPQHEPPVWRPAAPHFRSIAGESDVTKGSTRISHATPGKVCQATAVRLNQPDVERATPVRDEGDEFPVWRDSRICLGPLKVRERCELRIGKRVLDCVGGARKGGPGSKPRHYQNKRRCNQPRFATSGTC